MVEQLGGRLEFQSFLDNSSTCFSMLPHGGEPTTENTDAAKRSWSPKEVWKIAVWEAKSIAIACGCRPQ